MSAVDNRQIDKNAIRARFDRNADRFDQAAFVHRRIARGLIERMSPLQLAPELIIDAGSGTGDVARRLRKKFPRSRIVSLDCSSGMLRAAKRAQRIFRPTRLIQADARALPMFDGSVDLITANLLLPWLGEPDRALTEARRVLKPERPFVFSSLGPDSFRELRDAWRSIGIGENVQTFLDMHDLGDALVRAGFRDPVLDVERLTVTYGSFATLWWELRHSGSGNALRGRQKGLSTPRRFRKMEQAFRRAQPGGPIGLTLELVYGHAWAGRREKTHDNTGEYRVDVDEIRRL